MMFNNDAFMAGMKIPTKYTMEQELAQKKKLLEMQAELENQSLTAEEKLFRLAQQRPAEFQKFMEMKNALSPYQEGMLGIQRGQLGIQSQRVGAENTTPLQKNLPFLRQQYPNLTPEEILQMLVPGAKKKSSFSFSD